ncbi:glycosyltransferase family 2 protein [Chloroflexota bacterium]
MPTVSIVLPTYNGARYISQAIESCLNQTFTDLELIVVDDCSQDETPIILNSYKDPRLCVIHHSVNRKLPTALNTGFSRAQGDYFIWIADDDLFDQSSLEILAGYLEKNPQVDFVYADYCLTNEEGTPTKRINLFPQSPNQPHNTPAFLYRRNIFFELGGYNPEYFRVEDYEFWLRASQRFKMEYIRTEKPLYLLRQHQGTLSDNYRWYVHELSVKLRYDILGINYLEYSRQMAFVHVQAAFEAYRIGNPLGVCRRSLKAIIRDPTWLFNRGFMSITARSVWKCLKHENAIQSP